MPFDGTEVKKDSAATKALILARNRISSGWLQGRRLSYDGGRYGYCAVGAIIFHARAYGEEFIKAAWSLTKAIGGSDIASIEEWNDTPGRTKEDVLRAFDRAIELSRQQ